MMKLAISPAAPSLLRSLLSRAGVERDRILLTQFRSVDWNSLTFSGERHVIDLRITGADSADIVDRLSDGLEDAEFAIPGQIVADIAVVGAPVRSMDGSLSLTIEALTVAE